MKGSALAEGNFSQKDLRRALEAYDLTAETFHLLRKGHYGKVYRTTINGDVFVVKVRSPEARAEDVIFTGI